MYIHNICMSDVKLLLKSANISEVTHRYWIWQILTTELCSNEPLESWLNYREIIPSNGRTLQVSEL